MKIFLICPVRFVEDEEQEKIAQYVASLEEQGHEVHWPKRDTEQDDPSGGYLICRGNFYSILIADEIHIWYDEKSNGSKFDMGGVFMLEMLGMEKKVVIANYEEAKVLDEKDKSFLKVMDHLTD